jgi:hypothetical protein
MRKRPKKGAPKSPSLLETIGDLADSALATARTARKHRQSLDGANYYANKMANLRADATIAFSNLPQASADSVAVLAELVQQIFSVDASPADRSKAARDLKFALKTTWNKLPKDNSLLEEAGIFPLVKLNQTKRGYLVAVGRQINGSYASGWYDGCAVMMRRLLESSIIEAFEARKIDAKIKDPKSGDFFQLTALTQAALAESTWNLPRNVKKELGNLKDLGHKSAHNRYYLATKPDIDMYVSAYRESVEAFLHLAYLL